MRNIEDLMSLAAYTRDRVNSQMFIYSLSAAILYRNDTKNLAIPQLNEIFPDKFIDGETLGLAKEQANSTDTASKVR